MNDLRSHVWVYAPREKIKQGWEQNAREETGVKATKEPRALTPQEKGEAPGLNLNIISRQKTAWMLIV